LTGIFSAQAGHPDMYGVAQMNSSHIEAKVLEALGIADLASRRA